MPVPDTQIYLAELARWRANRDDFFVNHYATPLSDEAIAGFTGMQYFAPDLTLVFEIALELVASRVSIDSSHGATSEYPGAGKVTVPFPAGPKELLVLNGEEGDLFIPFRDATSGVSTYPGGRYLAIERAGNGRIAIDFNRATNPYCAYDSDFSCPLPPHHNWLGFSIEAGELDYR